jgi:hypothetical protein
MLLPYLILRKNSDSCCTIGEELELYVLVCFTHAVVENLFLYLEGSDFF